MRNPKTAWHAERRVSPHLHLEARHTCFQAGLGLKSLIPVCPTPYQYGYQLWWGAMLRGGQAAQLHLIVLVLKQLHPGSQHVIGMAAKRWMSTVISAAGKGAEPNAKQPPSPPKSQNKEDCRSPLHKPGHRKDPQSCPCSNPDPRGCQSLGQEGSSGGWGWLGLCVLPLSLPQSYSCPCPIPVSILPRPSCSAPVLVLPTTLSLPAPHPCPYPRLISAPVLLCPSPCLCPSLFLSCPSPSPCPAPLIAQAPAPRIPSPRRPFRPRVRRPLPPARPLPVPLLLQAVPELRQGQRGQLLLRHGASWQRRHGVGGGQREGRAGTARGASNGHRSVSFVSLLAGAQGLLSFPFILQTGGFTNPSRGNALRPVLCEPAPRQRPLSSRVTLPGSAGLSGLSASPPCRTPRCAAGAHLRARARGPGVAKTTFCPTAPRETAGLLRPDVKTVRMTTMHGKKTKPGKAAVRAARRSARTWPGGSSATPRGLRSARRAPAAPPLR